MNLMKATIIVITKNQKDLLKQSLPILLKQDLKGGFEIIVVDSGSTDGAIEYVKALPVELERIKLKPFNYARAFNLGARRAQGKYLVRLSGDAIPQKEDFLSQLLKPFFDSKVGGTYGRYTLSGRTGFDYPHYWPAERFPQETVRYSVKPQPFRMIFDGNHRKLIANFAGAACAIRRKLWQKRPLNENLSAADDAEYAWFLHEIGYDIVYNPKAIVIHEHVVDRLNQEERTAVFFTLWKRQLVAAEIKYYWKKFTGRDPFRKLKIEK